MIDEFCIKHKNDKVYEGYVPIELTIIKFQYVLQLEIIIKN